MAVTEFFRELAINQAPKQAEMVDYVTEEAPILAQIPMQATSNGLQNVYEELKEVDGAQFVGLDEALPTIGMDSELKYTDLSVLGGEMEVGEDKANRFGGAASYFTSKLPTVLRETGANTEQSILYNNIRAYAKTNGKLQDATGTNSGAMYSMLCVKWVAGETTGLYDPEGIGDGKVFDMQAANDGKLDKLASGIWGYSMRIKNYMGIQLANPRNVSGIANIDLVQTTPGTYDALPTEEQITKMIRDARATAGNSFIYCHPAVLDALQVYKGGVLQMEPTNDDYNRLIAYWNGIPFITSYNFKEDEATEVFS